MYITSLAIILIPAALVVILSMFVGAFIVWKLIIALLLWAAALILFLVNHAATNGSLFWYALITAIIGAFFYISWESIFINNKKT